METSAETENGVALGIAATRGDATMSAGSSRADAGAPLGKGDFVVLRVDHAPFVVDNLLEKRCSDDENRERLNLQWCSCR